MFSRYERDVSHHVDSYFDVYQRYLPDRMACFELAAEQLLSNGNQAFHDTTPDQVVFVSAGMAYEDRLTETLGQLAAQRKETKRPFVVALDANCVEGESDNPTTKRNLEIIRSAARTELPFSYFTADNEEGVTIGDIRERTLSGSILAYREKVREKHIPTTDILFTNWDADTVGATPGNFREAQETYAASRKIAWMGYPRLRHEELPAEFPAANFLLSWIDAFIAAGEASAPAAFSLNLGAIAFGQGFNGHGYGEHGQLWRSITRDRRVASSYAFTYLPQSEVTVSSRRLEHQMAEGDPMGYYGQLEAARHDASPFTKLRQDISPGYMQQALRDYVEQTYSAARRLFLFDSSRSANQQQRVPDPETAAHDHASRVIHEIAASLGHMHGSEDVIDEVIESYRQPV